MFSHHRLVTAALVAAVVLLSACSRREAAPSADTDAVLHSYTVRGQVAAVPSPDRPVDQLRIRHEAIPNFADRSGQVMVNSKGQRGMQAMTMAFPAAEGVSLEGIEPGDIVEFTLEVMWGEDYPTYQVTAIRELPADTVLDFSGATSGG